MGKFRGSPVPSPPTDSYPMRRTDEGINTDRESNRGNQMWRDVNRTHDCWVDYKTGKRIPKPDWAD